MIEYSDGTEDFRLSPSLAERAPRGVVPSAFAEKAMASLMQLHSELMNEKERRVDLYRRLMTKEQALAELRMYVRFLEDRLDLPPSERTVAMPGVQVEEVAQAAHAAKSAAQGRRTSGKVRADGWRSW
jgi:hypothetical protein